MLAQTSLILTITSHKGSHGSIFIFIDVKLRQKLASPLVASHTAVTGSQKPGLLLTMALKDLHT